MKSIYAVLFCVVSFLTISYSNGVGVVDSKNGIFLRLTSTSSDAVVQSQVATINTSQTFFNSTGVKQSIFYAYPLPEGASATALEWKINGKWTRAMFSRNPQDSSIGGGSAMNASLKNYLGNTPLLFTIPDTLLADSSLTVRLSYVLLLKYSMGNVFCTIPNKYSLIQSTAIGYQSLSFTLVSPRTIDSIFCLNHSPQTITNSGNTAYISYSAFESVAAYDYSIKYTLNLNQLGLFDYTIALPDSGQIDSYGKGYLLFIAEPDPSSTVNTIKKIFTIIVDRSGSMGSEAKMAQANNTAKFIVQNLNEGDYFNVIDFDDIISSFRPSHVPFTVENQTAALTYISALSARGNTDIAGAFSKAIPMYSGTSDSTAKIIIFLTDGQATAGTTSTTGILSIINNLTAANDTNITIFTFGIGSSVNNQLLSLIASQHHGLAEFLGNDELYSRVTSFYTKIRNPVLLSPKLEFSPNTVSEVYPNPLPNLYKGQQLLVSARYQTAGNIGLTLSGTAFNKPMVYNYNINLTDTSRGDYNFIPKIWAKLKIEKLLINYYSLDTTTALAKEIKGMITNLSVQYAISSPFTSFVKDPTPQTGVGEGGKTDHQSNVINEDFRIIGNYPNPFNPETKIRFYARGITSEVAVVKIFNSLGQLIRTLMVSVNREGSYEVLWDGKSEGGISVPSGNYIYLINIGDRYLAGKMTMLK